MLPYATNSGGGHQHLPFQQTRFGAFGRPALGSSTWAPSASATPQYNLTNVVPFSPYLSHFQHYLEAWEVS